MVTRMVRRDDDAFRRRSFQRFIAQPARGSLLRELLCFGICRNIHADQLKRNRKFPAERLAECSIPIGFCAADAVVYMHRPQVERELFPQIMQTEQQCRAVRTA